VYDGFDTTNTARACRASVGWLGSGAPDPGSALLFAAEGQVSVMGIAESSPVTVCSGRRRNADGRSDADYTVVWVCAEHVMGTVAVLSAAMADAIARDADVVVDLSGVAFMDASTLGVIIGARRLLRVRSRCLTVRAPSRCAQRILEVCGLAGLVDATSAPIAPVAGSAGAPRTRVAVSATAPVVARPSRLTAEPRPPRRARPGRARVLATPS
jgi:anti-anti-sigma factor